VTSHVALQRGFTRPDKTAKVGIVLAFTGHYQAVQILARFLELMGLDVVSSQSTTPKIMEAGTTLASSDLCLPLRVYVGHIYHLLQEHPDLDFIVAPNVHSPDAKSSTCAKYRDLGGVAIRSLSSTVSYLQQHAPGYWVDELHHLAGPGVPPESHLPRFLMPAIRAMDSTEMRNICYDVYADIRGWWPLSKARLWLPRRDTDVISVLEVAADRAYNEVLARRLDRAADLLQETTRPRLALVGRPYLICDPLLTCDLKRWFAQRGVAVITARDVPEHALKTDEVDGFYDSHREGQAFIDWAYQRVDGVVCVGCFGCHPDAFQVDFLADYARRLGVACWSFRFDESVSQAGFHTRFETILTFLEKRRDARLQRRTPSVVLPLKEGEANADAPDHFLSHETARRPVFLWPYMGEILNVVLEELAHQLGLGPYVCPPAPLSEQAMFLGDEHYTESCSPYAYSTGSLKESLLKITEELETRAAHGEVVDPHRVVLLMLHGEGPCTFGWYALVQKKEMPAEFAERLAVHGHTVEMATAGMDGAAGFLRQLGECSASRHLQWLLEFAEGGRSVGQYGRLLRVWREVTGPVWAKLDALERLRAHSLILRAHELQVGSMAAAYREAVEMMRQAHTLRDIAYAERQGKALLDAIPRDHELKPRIVIVGEIYVALTSFANRGAVETLLGREGIEVVEGVGLAQFTRHSLRNILRRSLRRVGGLRSVLDCLRRHNLDILSEQLRDPCACPFLVHEVGGDGVPTVGAARRHVEAGCQGIVHIHPFKCMPEGIAKDAVKEIACLYGARYLALSFDRETDIERLRTEVSTYAALLRAELASESSAAHARELDRRRRIGRLLNRAHCTYRRWKHTN
jgi:predicted nucleotide-binding protein (sugar kinase/HSP70/actin superfamily)